MRPRIKIRKIGRGKNCLFCKENLTPDYKEPEVLGRILSERGKIQSAERTGICASHQRQLTRQVKRARIIAFLPFAPKIT